MKRCFACSNKTIKELNNLKANGAIFDLAHVKRLILLQNIQWIKKGSTNCFFCPPKKITDEEEKAMRAINAF